MNKNYYFLIVILLITIISYSNSINNEFVDRNDGENVYQNECIKGITKNNLRKLFTTQNGGMYSPVAMLTYSLDYTIAKLNPKMYHLTNLIIHLLNIILVFFLFLLITKRIEISVIVSILFGIHPLNTDSVSWISVRGGVLYTFFYLGAIISYIYYINKEYKKQYLIITLILFLLSIFSKPAAVGFPIILLIIDWYYGRKINMKVLLEKSVFIFFVIIIGIITYYLRNEQGQLLGVEYNFIDKCILSLYAIYFYISELFIPNNLSPYIPIPLKSSGFYPVKFYIIPILVLLSFYFLYKLLKFKKLEKYRKDIILGLLFFIIHILIVLIRPFYGREFVANRYTYLPYLGIFYLISILYFILIDKFSRIKKYLNVFLVIIVLFFSVYTYSRNNIWKNSVAMWTDAIEKYPDLSYYPYLSRGFSRGEVKDYKGAIEDYNIAIKLLPDYYLPYYSRGLMKYNIKDFKGALADFDKAIRLNSEIFDEYKLKTYNFRGKVKLELSNYKGAIEDFTTLIKYSSDKSSAYNNRGFAKFMLKDFEGALQDFNKSILLDNKNSEAYFNRGRLELYLNKIDNANIDFSTVIAINPNDWEAYNYRGKIRMTLKDIKRAIQDFDIVLYFEPSLEEAYANRAYAKAYLADYEGAVDDYTHAIQLNPSDSDSYKKREIAISFLNQKNSGKSVTSDIKLNSKKMISEENKNNKEAVLFFKSGLNKYFKRDYKGAIIDFDRSLKLNPELYNAYKNRANAKVALKDYGNALIDFNKAIKLNPRDTDSYFNRGYLKNILKDFDGAFKDYSKALELNPKDGEIYMYRADCRITKGDLDGACNDWYKAYNLGFKDAAMILHQNCMDYLNKKGFKF